MRTAIASAIYRKTLTISNSARKDFSTGEITNLMSIDAQRFVEIVPYLNTVWSGCSSSSLPSTSSTTWLDGAPLLDLASLPFSSQSTCELVSLSPSSS